jgi:DNA (cytosine-5)-methyltransferase 1
LSFSFDDFDVPVRSAAVSYIEKALQHIHIPLQVDSLFSGAGLMDVGFLQVRIDVVFAAEQNRNAVKTYRENIGKHILQADITKIDKTRFTSPVMIGGSPCQGFSNANRYTNYLDNPNNRLVRSYIGAVKANKNRKVFVLEMYLIC